MVGEQVPPGMDKEKTKTRCVTAKEAEDIEKRCVKTGCATAATARKRIGTGTPWNGGPSVRPASARWIPAAP